VTLSEYKITSSVTTFSPGTSYHFVVTNKGQVAHEFMIMPMGMSVGGISMDEMHKIALHMIDNVAVLVIWDIRFQSRRCAPAQSLSPLILPSRRGPRAKKIETKQAIAR
jgi:hypothetical protein